MPNVRCGNRLQWVVIKQFAYGQGFCRIGHWATSRVLAETIKHIGTFDLILAGERATDGDTGQVGPAVASWLGIPALTYVSSLEIESRTKDSRIAESDHNRTSSLTFLVRRLTEEGYQKVRVKSPA